jgi:EAL domain-containing protein (putative c-di-GMP-specific phosphodiesterase class I)
MAAARPALALAPDWHRLLAEACAGKGVQAVYQPLVDLRRGEVVGYEGLARFTARRDLDTERWFAAARSHDCEAELDAATLAVVLAARDDLPPHTFLSVNVSPTTLATPPVAQALGRERDLQGVVIELTEQSPVECYADLSRHLNIYRSRGALVAIDDAGSGYSGLAHILELRPSILKLDRSLISNVDRDEAKRVLVEMLGLYAGHLDAWILAEGVETLAELETLRNLGVPLAQGWVLGRPAGPWASVDSEAAALLRQAPADLDETGCTVKLLLERARSVPRAQRHRAAADIVAEPLDAFVVVVDGQGAPVGAYTPASARAGQMAPVMSVSLATTIPDVAHRALARAPDHRFEPVVCVDPAGRTLGIVRIERVLELLARLVARGHGENPPGG